MVLGIWDAVIFYGIVSGISECSRLSGPALRETLFFVLYKMVEEFLFQALNVSVLHGNGSVRNGRGVTSNIWGHSFMGVVIECTISPYGDRNFPYFLLDLDPTEKSFQVKMQLKV